MANNPYVNKVVFGNTTLIDTSGVTVSPLKLLNGETALDASGALISGVIQSKAAQTYTPGTSNQTIQSGQYLTGAQTIAGDLNLISGNIKSGVSVFNVSGSFTGSSTVSTGQTAATSSQILSGYSAWVNGAEVKGSIGIATLQEVKNYLGIN